jgi:hypothetical protein
MQILVYAAANAQAFRQKHMQAGWIWGANGGYTPPPGEGLRIAGERLRRYGYG